MSGSGLAPCLVRASCCRPPPPAAAARHRPPPLLLTARCHSAELGKMYLEGGQYEKLEQVIRDLHHSCQKDGKDDEGKGSYLLEVYALRIQLCSATKNNAVMQEVYPKTLNLNSAIADPRIMGVIRESGGKMYMAQKDWVKAYNEFFEAFRNYQEVRDAANGWRRPGLTTAHPAGG